MLRFTCFENPPCVNMITDQICLGNKCPKKPCLHIASMLKFNGSQTVAEHVGHIWALLQNISRARRQVGDCVRHPCPPHFTDKKLKSKEVKWEVQDPVETWWQDLKWISWMAPESRAGLWAVSMVLVSFKISTYVLGVGTDRGPAGLIL